MGKRISPRAVIVVALLLVAAGTLTARNWRARHMTVTATAYCPCSECTEHYADGFTAIMRDAQLPGVAVDPKHIPLRARIDIPGYGNWVIADDVGGAIKGRRIDVRFKTHEEALEWGVKKIRIRIWE